MLGGRIINRRDFLENIAAFPALLFPLNFEKKPEPLRPQTLSLEVPIAGFQYYKIEEVWKRLRKNDPLRLRREPKNPHDPRAIEVFWKNKKLGYIPREDNSLLAKLLDRNCPVKAEIKRLKESWNPWDRVEVRVEIMP